MACCRPVLSPPPLCSVEFAVDPLPLPRAACAAAAASSRSSPKGSACWVSTAGAAGAAFEAWVVTALHTTAKIACAAGQCEGLLCSALLLMC